MKDLDIMRKVVKEHNEQFKCLPLSRKQIDIELKLAYKQFQADFRQGTF